MLSRIFNPENGFFRVTGKLFDAVMLSLLWVLLCLPVVTIGPATAALYYTAIKCLRGNEPAPFSHFLRSFRENFKVGALAGLLLTALWVFFTWGYLWMATAAETSSAGFVMFFAYYLALSLPLALTCFAFATLGRFTFGVGGLLKTSLQLVLAHIPSAVVVAAATAQAVVLTLRYWFPVAFLPTLLILLWSLFLERIYAPYLPAEPEPEDRGPQIK